MPATVPHLGKRVLAALELVFWLTLFSYRGDLTHYTWWGIVDYAVFLVCCIVHKQQYAWLHCVVTQIVVITGVAAMSTTQCSLIRDAADDMGALQYTLGNFGLHYAPLVLLVARKTVPRMCRRQGTTALIVFILYCAVQKPNAVYGCSMPYSVVVLFGTGASVAAAYLICCHEQALSHWPGVP